MIARVGKGAKLSKSDSNRGLGANSGKTGEKPDPHVEPSLIAKESWAQSSEKEEPTTNGNDSAKAAPNKLGDQSIGHILVEIGRISAPDAQRVAQFASEFKIRFGDAAVEMELVKRSDVDFALGQQFSFPRLEKSDLSLSKDLVAAYDPELPFVEQLRELRTQIVSRAVTGGRRHPMVAITSPNRGDGRSYIAANLAVVFAQMGHRTLIVDADLRNPTQHKYFRCDNRIGLSTLLAGRSGIECLYKVDSFPRIFVIPAGPTPPNPVELLARPVLAQLLASADANFRAVIIDTPATSVAADARVIGGCAGANVIVARFGSTKTTDGRHLLEAFEADKSNVLGVVLNTR